MYCLAGEVPVDLNFKDRAMIAETRYLEERRSVRMLTRDVLVMSLKFIEINLMLICS